MSDEIKAAVRRAVEISFRLYDTLTEQEREAVLIALCEVEPEAAGHIAQTALFHLQQQKKAQLHLTALLDGIGKPHSNGDGQRDGEKKK